MADEPLIDSLLAGDPDVVELVRSWIRAAFGPYRARLGADLEDLEQEILIDLSAALREGRFRHQSSLRTYVRTYVHHKCIDRLRSESRRQWLDIDGLELTSQSPSPLDELASTEATEVALRIAEEMPATCRQLWQMLMDGLSYRQMSQRLEISEGALRVRMLRCRKDAQKLRRKIFSKKLRNKSRAASTR